MQRRAAIVERLGMITPHRQRPIVARQRLLEPPLPRADDRGQVQGIEIVGPGIENGARQAISLTQLSTLVGRNCTLHCHGQCRRSVAHPSILPDAMLTADTSGLASGPAVASSGSLQVRSRIATYDATKYSSGRMRVTLCMARSGATLPSSG